MYKEYIKRIKAIEVKKIDEETFAEMLRRDDEIVEYLLNNPAPNRNIHDFESKD